MQDKTGDNCKEYNYSFSDKVYLKKSNLFWYFVDHLSSKLDNIAKLYEKYVSREYRNEASLFNISDSKSILHVGCGAYPITAMTLAETNSGKITGIDRNLRDVRLAKEIIKRKNLEDRIRIENEDGTIYPIDDFDMIVVSGCSVPKIEVLKHIFQNAKPNTRIIVREAYTKNKPVDKLINSYKDIKILKRIGNHPFSASGWESFYLLKT